MQANVEDFPPHNLRRNAKLLLEGEQPSQACGMMRSNEKKSTAMGRALFVPPFYPRHSAAH